jgi:hypothetical protein
LPFEYIYFEPTFNTSNQLPVNNYFLVAGESTFGAITAGESAFGATTAGESTFGATTAGESTFGVSVVSPLLQAVNTDATAIAKNTFFICFCLNF